MSIGILAPPNDKFATTLAEHLSTRYSIDVKSLDLRLDGAESVSLDDAVAHWRGVDLAGLQRLFISGFEYQDPVVPRTITGTDWSRWQYGHLADQQRFSAFYSIVSELQRRGVEVINPLRAHELAFSRPALLARLARDGLPVADFTLTNDHNSVPALQQRHPHLLWRPATGRAAWQRFEDKQRDALVGPERPPVLLAPGRPDAVQRVWMYAGRPLLQVLIEPAAARESSTLGSVSPFASVVDFGEVEWLECLEVVEVQGVHVAAQTLDAVCESLGAPWVEITFCLNDRTPVIFDVDPAPRFDWLPEPLWEILIDALANEMASNPLGVERPVAPSVGARFMRPAMFLRRALQFQFEMEESKYIEADATTSLPPG